MPGPAKDGELTLKQARFVDEYLKHGSPTMAYRLVYNTENMKPATIHARAWELARHPKLSVLIQEGVKKIASDNVVMRERLIEQWLMMALADPNELTQHRHLNCRHCHGVGHKYRWRNADEFAVRLAEAIDKDQPLPTDEGGYGFRRTDDPHDDCPYCDGEGIPDTHFADTRKLSRVGQALYAGAKVTKNGLEIMMHDQNEARRQLARILGLNNDGIDLKLPGGASLTAAAISAVSPADAARAYTDVMEAGGNGLAKP